MKTLARTAAAAALVAGALIAAPVPVQAGHAPCCPGDVDQAALVAANDILNNSLNGSLNDVARDLVDDVTALGAHDVNLLGGAAPAAAAPAVPRR